MKPTRPTLGRRTVCLCCLAAPGVPRAAAARAEVSTDAIVLLILTEATKSPIRVHRLRGGVAVLEGSGRNVAVLQGPEGKLLVDAGIAVSRPQLGTALDSLGEELVTRLINTHWQFDHASGNAWLNQAGARISAHSNTRKRLVWSGWSTRGVWRINTRVDPLATQDRTSLTLCHPVAGRPCLLANSVQRWKNSDYPAPKVETSEIWKQVIWQHVDPDGSPQCELSASRLLPLRVLLARAGSCDPRRRLRRSRINTRLRR